MLKEDLENILAENKKTGNVQLIRYINDIHVMAIFIAC
jgi:hypothetical protein